MNEATYRRLEYDRVKATLATYAMSPLGRAHIERLAPLIDAKVIGRLLEETEEAVGVIRHGSSVPIPALEGVEPVMELLGTGYVLSEEDVAVVGKLLDSVERLKRYMERKREEAPHVCSYAASMFELRPLRAEIDRCIRHGRVADEASKELARIRKKIAVTEERIRKKLDAAMQKHRSALQEYVVSLRGDRYVLPVRKECRKQVPGNVLDESSSGQTVFIEPADIGGLTMELAGLRAEEGREEAKVLAMLTGLIEAHQYELSVDLETIGYYDFLFAKAKYALAIDGRNVALGASGAIRIRGGKHPLLGRDGVALDFAIGAGYRCLVITGPNTGGKTVALKTVGLLTLMAQSGLLVPVAPDSRLAVFESVLADIGDGQSIEQSLSTFSAHMTNVIAILREADASSLVLLDELATGTDPGEGVGLSIAVLEALHAKAATVVATTHFNEIKRFAADTPGFENARMEFDAATMRPLYRLRIGEAGSSHAFEIAAKLGIPPALIARAEQITRGELAAVAPGPPDGTEAAAAAAGNARRTPAGADADPPAGNGRAEAKRAAFEVGDCVWIHSLRRTGVVAELADAKGNLLVQVQKEKLRINHKRLAPYIPRKQLYPGEDYDMDIVFESKDVRKKRHAMRRKHVPGLTIEYPDKE